MYSQYPDGPSLQSNVVGTANWQSAPARGRGARCQPRCRRSAPTSCMAAFLFHRISSLPSGAANIPVTSRAWALSLEASFGQVRGSACGLFDSPKPDHDRSDAENKAATQQRDHQHVPQRPAINDSWEIEAVQSVE